MSRLWREPRYALGVIAALGLVGALAADAACAAVAQSQSAAASDRSMATPADKIAIAERLRRQPVETDTSHFPDLPEAYAELNGHRLKEVGQLPSPIDHIEPVPLHLGGGVRAVPRTHPVIPPRAVKDPVR